MPSGSYLVRRGRTYSFRCRLPIDLSIRVGRGEFVRALGTDQGRLARFLTAGLAIHLSGLWTGLRMIELDSEIEAALEVWFKQELDRAWKQYDSGAFARAMIPPGSSREEELALGRSLLNGDAQTQLGLLEADYPQHLSVSAPSG